jgi:polar amino acid transport system substrate-binding protein
MSFGILVHQVYGETLLIGAESSWPPYANSDATGLANDLVRAAYSAVGIEVEYILLPYPRVLNKLDNGTLVAGFNVPLDNESRKKYIFGKNKLLDAVTHYYQSIDNPISAKRREDLNNEVKVGTVIGFGYGNHFPTLVNEGKVLDIRTIADKNNLKKLSMNRLDTTIITNKTANLLLKELQLEDKIEIAFINSSTPMYLAFSKKFPKAEYYANLFDKGMDIILENGVYTKITNSY